MSIECTRRGGIDLSQGVCDTEVPEIVRQGARTAISDGVNHYTRYDGHSDLRQAIAKKMMHFNGIPTDPEKNVVISCGATGAFYCTCLSLLSPADEVIVFEPYYGYHVNTLRAVGAVPIVVPTHAPDWRVDPDEVAAAIGGRCKAIIVNTPANPSGKVFSREELLVLGQLSQQYGLWIISDEIYEYFTFDGRRHISPASLSDIGDRCITISGYSKTFSITGWRIGYAVADARWAHIIGLMNDLVYVCSPAPLQIGVARGIELLDESYYEALRGEYTEKRKMICDALKAGGLEPHVPQGAYYVLADVSKLPGSSSKEKAMFLLEKHGVATVPGSAFCDQARGEHLVRLCFAKRSEILQAACDRLGNI